MPPETAVIIVNYNAGAALSECLESVFRQGQNLSVVVVDNASTDGSADWLAAHCANRPELVLLRNDRNAGFASAVNQAARRVLAPAAGASEPACLLLLNPDCVLDPGALEALRAALERDAEAALAGPRVTDANGRVQRGTLRRFPDPWKSFLTVSGLWRLGRHWPVFRGVEQSGEAPDSVAVAEAVSGACMLVRTQAFREVGGMDEAYGLHCEDLDLMYRLRVAGHHCLFVPEAHAVHHQGLSSGSRPLWVHWQKHRGMQRFFGKFQASRYPWPLRVLVIAGIWTRYALTLPPALWRRARRAAGDR